MSDTFTEVSEEGLFTRIKNAIVGVLVGIVMFLGAAGLLFWNEGRAVYRAQALEEGLASVISVQPDKVDSANQGKLVHMSGTATTEETLTDNTFGITQPKILRLSREVEMYQWKETEHTKTEKRTGGKKVTTKTYSYDKTWSSSVINSSSFKKSGHDNPGSMRFNNESWNARKVDLGAFVLTSGQIGSITGWENIPVTEAKTIPSGGQVLDSVIYFGTGSQSSPQIGDLRVSFKKVNPQVISLYAGQTGNSFEEYTTSNGNTLMRLQMGSVSAKEMFAAAQTENTILTWVLRLVGFVLMLIGVSLVFNPIQVMADIIPFIGDIIGMGLGFLAFAIAAPSALFVIAIAWIVYRPILGIILLGFGMAIFVGIYKMAAGKKEAAGGGASAPSAPASSTPPPLPQG